MTGQMDGWKKLHEKQPWRPLLYVISHQGLENFFKICACCHLKVHVIHIQRHLCFTFPSTTTLFYLIFIKIIYVSKDEFQIIKVFDLHIRIANCLKCPKF
jgi:hypothetical protein